VSGRHPNGGMIPEGFDSAEIIQYEEHDREKYFYRDDDIYMQCIKREETLDYSPSCTVYFNYKELELTVNFASKYKTNFLNIHARIQELLKSFEQSLDNLVPADVFYGRDQFILDKREKIKLRTLATRRQIYYKKYQQTQI
jgi:hypothetical protein